MHAVCVAERYSDAPETFEWAGTELPTKDIFEVLLDVQNSGNVPIASADFERPLNLIFDSKSVLFTEVLEEKPEDLGTSVSTWSNRVRLAPMLLNAGDTVGLEIWVHGYGGVRTEGRVVGVERIRRFSTIQELARSGLLSSVMTIGAIAVAFVLDFFPQAVPSLLIWPILSFLLAGLLLTLREFYRGYATLRGIKRKAERQEVLHANWDP